ncbi:MAG TPA: hypothetical protein VMR37_08085 [Rhabdochlamydiaceae bacterium]|jgi:hypothetical protein|nr:hypothetical protein [Rhabdochlamydiaceae bacterium]
MISSINPIGSSNPSEIPSDVTSTAKLLDKELADLIAVLGNLKPETVDAQQRKVAEIITATSAQAQKVLIATGA